MTRKVLLFAALLLWLPSVQAAPESFTIGVVVDGPEARALFPLDLLEREVATLFGDEIPVRIPAEFTRDGGWTAAGIDAALQGLLSNPKVDVVIALGVIASNQAAAIRSPAKPLIAAVTPDARLQGFPLQGLVSGRRNFTYISNRRSVHEDLAMFHEAVGFSHLALLADALTLETIPALSRELVKEISSALNIRLTIVSVTDSVERGLAQLPGDADAVYLTPLLRLSRDEMRQLAAGLIERRLPSFSILGANELEYGVLMATRGRPGDATRYARRLALNLQRIALGENAGTIEVNYVDSPRIMINMRTARAIGFSPRYAVLADAERLYDDELAQGRPLSMIEAMNEAVAANLGLKAAALDPEIAGDDLRLARSGLLPQVGISASAVRIDADRANPLFQAERSTDAELTTTQIIYSDDVWAAYSGARSAQSASLASYRAVLLDTQQLAATRYLQLLRALALEAVRRANVEVTRTNLDLARLRESLGASGRADVLRWESQFATDKRNLIVAQADRRKATSALNSTLNRPQNETIAPIGVKSALQIFDDSRFRTFVDNAIVWELFQDFSVDKALANAPEVVALEHQIVAQERQVLAAKRKFYVPDLALQVGAGSNISRSGAGSDLTGTGLDDESWNVAIVARLPVFNGNALRADLSRERHRLDRLQRQRDALLEAVEARVRQGLHQASGSFPAVELTAQAAAAAAENLRLVTDAYSKGAVSVTELIDAQNASLSASLANADAKYAYIIDVVEILRASGDLGLVTHPETALSWFEEVERYFATHGGSLPKR